MLTKLIKYELRASRKILPLVFLATILLAAAGAVTAVSPSFPMLFLSYMLLMLLGSAALTVTYIVLIVRFHKGMFGAEGYLAHTIPVDVKTLYRSKTTVSLIWMVIGTVVAMAAWASAMFVFSRMITATAGDSWPVEMTEAISMTFSAPFVCWLIVSTILGWLGFLGVVFFCLTLANVRPFSKLGLGSSVLAYIAINLVIQIFSVLLMAALPLSMKFTLDSGWFITNQTMWSWFLDTLRVHQTEDPGFVLTLGLNLPQLVTAFVLPIFTERMIERKMIVK